MREKRCVECNEPFNGRSDKKFCSELCRNSYNNRLNSKTNNLMRNINNILRKNRRLLEEHIISKTTKLPKAKLAEKGFNFNFHTNLYTTRKGDTYSFCYEYGYLPLEGDFLLLVKRKDPLD